MDKAYRTVFEVSYFSNGNLLLALGFLAVGIAMAVAALAGKLNLRKEGTASAVGVTIWCVVWISFSILMTTISLREGWKYTNALRDGHASVVEGTVELLYEQPKGGHAPGDRIRVNGREFQYSNFRATLAYRRTVANGGILTNGAKVRLHYLDGAIIKVELAE